MNDREAATIANELSCGRTVVTTTTGVSMRPLLIEGQSHVVIEPVSHPLKVGDLPIYIRPDGKYVIHRIIRVDETHYYTRGDNCISYETIPRSWVLGRVVEICRKGTQFKVTCLPYRIYVRVWLLFYPVNSVILKIKYHLKWKANEKNK